ncbi:TPA: NTP transferase domain-containing protein [Sulfurisphaera tokodaii]|uniref:NTP transferase domain-containing protein n=1 Tax=Sulfurisphaera tokodaii TaxID=111955 RepID=A0A832WUB8_9CREN|nr:NTP transferase domain-containing protein [Sulfurisphaera tokodaii]
MVLVIFQGERPIKEEKKLKFKNSFDVIILAGGESKRFGSDKCSYELDGKTFLERIADNFPNPIIVTHKKRNIFHGIQIIDIERKGPVKAIELALPYLTKDKVFITGCDFPFITYDLADFICSKDSEISIILEEEEQPLLACYSVKLLRKNINNVFSLQQLLNFANTIYFIGTYELQLHGFSLFQLKNINSWMDFFKIPDKYTLSKYIIQDNQKC